MKPGEVKVKPEELVGATITFDNGVVRTIAAIFPPNASVEGKKAVVFTTIDESWVVVRIDSEGFVVFLGIERDVVLGQ